MPDFSRAIYDSFVIDMSNFWGGDVCEGTALSKPMKFHVTSGTNTTNHFDKTSYLQIGNLIKKVTVFPKIFGKGATVIVKANERDTTITDSSGFWKNQFTWFIDNGRILPTSLNESCEAGQQEETKIPFK